MSLQISSRESLLERPVVSHPHRKELGPLGRVVLSGLGGKVAVLGEGGHHGLEDSTSFGFHSWTSLNHGPHLIKHPLPL